MFEYLEGEKTRGHNTTAPDYAMDSSVLTLAEVWQQLGQEEFEARGRELLDYAQAEGLNFLSPSSEDLQALVTFLRSHPLVVYESRWRRHRLENIKTIVEEECLKIDLFLEAMKRTDASDESVFRSLRQLRHYALMEDRLTPIIEMSDQILDQKILGQNADNFYDPEKRAFELDQKFQKLEEACASLKRYLRYMLDSYHGGRIDAGFVATMLGFASVEELLWKKEFVGDGDLEDEDGGVPMSWQKNGNFRNGKGDFGDGRENFDGGSQSIAKGSFHENRSWRSVKDGVDGGFSSQTECAGGLSCRWKCRGDEVESPNGDSQDMGPSELSAQMDEVSTQANEVPARREHLEQARRLIVDFGCGNGDILIEIARALRRRERGRELIQMMERVLSESGIRVNYGNIFSRSKVRTEFISYLEFSKIIIPQNLEPLDPHLIGIDEAEIVLEELRLNQGIATRAADMCARDFFETASGEKKAAHQCLQGKVGVAISILTLDRVADLDAFLNNFSEALENDGRFLLGNKGLIDPRSDGVGAKIVYRRGEKSDDLTSESYAGTLTKLRRKLAQFGLVVETIALHPYAVISVDGVQYYPLVLVGGRKKMTIF